MDGSVTAHQGLRLAFSDGARIVWRLSGTGTEGATLRVYIERYEADPAHLHADPQATLAPLIALARDLSGIADRTGRTQPDVVS